MSYFAITLSSWHGCIMLPFLCHASSLFSTKRSNFKHIQNSIHKPVYNILSRIFQQQAIGKHKTHRVIINKVLISALKEDFIMKLITAREIHFNRTWRAGGVHYTIRDWTSRWLLSGKSEFHVFSMKMPSAATCVYKETTKATSPVYYIAPW